MGTARTEPSVSGSQQLNERLLRACRRERVDRTPVWFMRQAGRSDPKYLAIRGRASLLEICRTPALCAEITLRPVEDLGVDAAILFADITLPLGGMGVAFDLQDGIGPQIRHPIRTETDLATLRPFELDDTMTGVLDAIRLIRRASPVPLVGFAGGSFTLASYLIEGGPSRDFIHTKTMMAQAPGLWQQLMTQLTAATICYLQAQVAAGAQAVQVFDSWVGALSPADYADHVAPYSRAVFAAIATTGVPSIHFGTSTAGLLPAMTAAGGDIIGVDWRIDLADAWARIGSGRGIQGNLEPAMLLAPVDVLRARAQSVLDQAAGRPGHIFNLGHGVLPQTPRDRLRWLVEMVHEYSGRGEGNSR